MKPKSKKPRDNTRKMFMLVDLSTVSGNKCKNAPPIKAHAANPTRHNKILSSTSSLNARLTTPTKAITLIENKLAIIRNSIKLLVPIRTDKPSMSLASISHMF